MNKMYNYLEKHSYISKNKHSNYQFELTKERAECIANKYDGLTKELQQSINKAIDKLYTWGEVLDAEFQKEMLDILEERSK